MNIPTTFEQQQPAGHRLSDRDLANVVLAELKRAALAYTTAALDSVNPHVRDAFRQMMDRTLQHHEMLAHHMTGRGWIGGIEQARQEDVHKRIIREQQRGNELHAFVHHNLQYGQSAAQQEIPPHISYGSSAASPSAPQLQPRPGFGGMPAVNPYQPQQHDAYREGVPDSSMQNPNVMGQLQAHQPGTFGFNQEFGHNEQQANRPGRHYGRQQQTGQASAYSPPPEPLVPGRQAPYTEQQVEALARPGAGVYQSAGTGSSATTTGADVTANHTGDQEETNKKKQTDR